MRLIGDNKKITFNYNTLFIILIFVSLLFRLFFAYNTVIVGDAFNHVERAFFISDTWTFGKDCIPFYFYHPPMFHLLLAIIYSLFRIVSENLGMIALLSVTPFLGVASLFMIYLILKKLFDTTTALFATALISFTPVHLFYSSETYADLPLFFFGLVSLYFALEKKPFFSGLFFALAFLTKQNAYMLAPVLFFLLFRSLKSTSLFVLGALPGLSWYIFLWFQVGNPVYPFMTTIFGGKHLFFYEASTMPIKHHLLNLINVFVGLFEITFGLKQYFLSIIVRKILAFSFVFGIIVFFKKGFSSRDIILALLTFGVLVQLCLFSFDHEVIYSRMALFLLIPLFGYLIYSILMLKKPFKLFFSLLFCSCIIFLNVVYVHDFLGYINTDGKFYTGSALSNIIKDIIPKQNIVFNFVPISNDFFHTGSYILSYSSKLNAHYGINQSIVLKSHTNFYIVNANISGDMNNKMERVCEDYNFNCDYKLFYLNPETGMHILNVTINR